MVSTPVELTDSSSAASKDRSMHAIFVSVLVFQLLVSSVLAMQSLHTDHPDSTDLLLR